MMRLVLRLLSVRGDGALQELPLCNWAIVAAIAVVIVYIPSPDKKIFRHPAEIRF